MKKKLILLSIFVIIGGASFWYYQNNSKKNEVTYTSAELSLGNIEVSVLATGTVKPQNRLEIKSPIAGRVEEVLIKEGDNAKKGQILAWLSSTERAALLDSARAKGVKEVKKWENLYRPTPIIAPISGTIILKNVEAGQTFNTTDAIFVMSDRLAVKAMVDETDLAQIKIDQLATVRLDSYPKDEIAAKVASVAFEAVLTNNVTTYSIDVLPLEVPEFMRSGMTANVTFVIEKKENILIVPNEAITYEDDKKFIRLASSPEKLIEIQTGISDGKSSEILGEFRAGEKILIAELKFSETTDAPTSPFSPTRRKQGRK
jgi:macrolide-specific efflux system membrane fusion protein